MATRPSRRNRRGVPRGPTSAMPATMPPHSVPDVAQVLGECWLFNWLLLILLTMPVTIPRLPDVAQVPWKVRWLFNWLLFDKLEAVRWLFNWLLFEPMFLLLESALQDITTMARNHHHDGPVDEVD